MFLPRRQMITDYWEYTRFFLERHNPQDPRSCRCPARITLDGVRYQCTRVVHPMGSHDAGTRHSDGGLVRW